MFMAAVSSSISYVPYSSYGWCQLDIHWLFLPDAEDGRFFPVLIIVARGKFEVEFPNETGESESHFYVGKTDIISILFGITGMVSMR
jgi:hypothetical protein